MTELERLRAEVAFLRSPILPDEVCAACGHKKFYHFDYRQRPDSRDATKCFGRGLDCDDCASRCERFVRAFLPPEEAVDDRALGQRLVTLRGWRWVAGMLRRDGYRVCWRKPAPALCADDEIPDLTDAATRGCIVELLREEVAKDSTLHVLRAGGDPETGAWHVRWNGGLSARRGRTEGEALVRAWEALV